MICVHRVLYVTTGTAVLQPEKSYVKRPQDTGFYPAERGQKREEPIQKFEVLINSTDIGAGYLFEFAPICGIEVHRAKIQRSHCGFKVRNRFL